MLIDYKKEFEKNHSDIVLNALNLALEEMLKRKDLDKETKEDIIDRTVNLKQFKKNLMKKSKYVKSKRELMKEFEKIREQVNADLRDSGLIYNIKTVSNVDKNLIEIQIEKNAPGEFLKEFFGINSMENSEVFFNNLVQKKGFMERYCFLRITKVMKEIFKEKRNIEHIMQNYSVPFWYPEILGFGVYYIYAVNVDYIENRENRKKIINEIKSLDKEVQSKFEKKMGLEDYGFTIKPMLNSQIAEETFDLNKDEVSEDSIEKDSKTMPITNMVENIEDESVVEDINEDIDEDIDIEKNETDFDIDIEDSKDENDMSLEIDDTNSTEDIDIDIEIDIETDEINSELSDDLNVQDSPDIEMEINIDDEMNVDLENEIELGDDVEIEIDDIDVSNIKMEDSSIQNPKKNNNSKPKKGTPKVFNFEDDEFGSVKD